MADSRKIIRVFLASPGDLEGERRTAKSVVDEFNSLWADPLGYHIELIGWEDTVAGFGRPQALINQDLERCELFVGMIWKRWGTPPDNAGHFTSGFEEELTSSIERRAKTGRPAISLFFKNIDSASLSDPGEQLKKVIALQASIISEKNLYFERFDESEFEQKFRRCITRYVQDLRAKDTRQSTSESSALPVTREQSDAQRLKPLSDEGINFLHKFLSTLENPPEERSTKVEAARFRLLANLFGKSGNDEQSLGVHDANILFLSQDSTRFGRDELFGLIASGLEFYQSKNAPLWCWISLIDGFKRHVLSMLSIFGPHAQRIGALQAMRTLFDPIADVIEGGRSRYLAIWFSKESSTALKVAALAYLGDCGYREDLQSIKDELESADHQTTYAAVDAILCINLRNSRASAFEALIELQPESISQSLLDDLFEKGASINDKTLIQCLTHRCAKVRHLAASSLRERGELDVESAERLTLDADAKVRFEALVALESAGRLFSDEEAKNILVRMAPTGFGLLGRTDPSSDECWKQFRKSRMTRMSLVELEPIASGASILDRTAQFVLTERHFSRYGHRLRTAVDDSFKTEFYDEVARVKDRFGADVDTAEKLASLEEYLRKKLTREALNIICRNGDPVDLTRIRRALTSGFVDYSDEDVNYLRKFGEWDDIPLIVASLTRTASGENAVLISSYSLSRYRTAADAIYHIGRDRFRDLFAFSMPNLLLAKLIAVSSEASFRSLNDGTILTSLRSSDDGLRKTAALKCVQVLPKTRLRTILSDYVAGDDKYYYNVVHCLDLGISAPRNRAVAAARKEIIRELYA